MTERTAPPRERICDLLWVAENLHVLLPAAIKAHAVEGRGAILVDCTTTVQGVHRFCFAPRADMPPDDVETLRMVDDYNPTAEVVIVLIKKKERTSTYRVGSQHLMEQEEATYL